MPSLAGRIPGKLVPDGVKLPADPTKARWIRAMDSATPAYLELRAKFPAESADDIADRMIGEFVEADPQDDGSALGPRNGRSPAARVRPNSRPRAAGLHDCQSIVYLWRTIA